MCPPISMVFKRISGVCCGVGMSWGIGAFNRFRGFVVLDGMLDECCI